MVHFWQNRTYSFAEFPPTLNANVISRFKTSTTVQSMVEQLMLESWSQNVTYESYFNQCAPRYCTYSVIERRDVVFLITLLLGVFGGLSLLLRLLTLWAIQIVFCVSSRQQREYSKSFAIRQFTIVCFY